MMDFSVRKLFDKKSL